MTTDRIEVITSVQRRRRWTAAEKGQLVAASLEPGALKLMELYPIRRHSTRKASCSRSPEALRTEYRAIIDAGLDLQVDDAFIPFMYEKIVPPMNGTSNMCGPFQLPQQM
jgi:hypothetical protein